MTEHTTQLHAPLPAEQAPSLRIYYQIFGALMGLLVLTITVSFVNLGTFNEIIALVIAAAKAVLVILFFMHVRTSSRLTWLFAAAGFVWLLILVGWTFSDYLSRGWMGG